MILDTYQQCSKRHGLFIDCKLKNNDEENEQHTKFRTEYMNALSIADKCIVKQLIISVLVSP